MHIHRIKTDRTSSDKKTSPTDSVHYHVYNGETSTFNRDVHGHTHKIGEVATGPSMEIIGGETGPRGRVIKVREGETVKMHDAGDEFLELFGFVEQFENGMFEFSDTRGDFVFGPDHAKVTDNQGHYPLNSIDRARNALARINQYTEGAPPWWSGSLEELKNAVKRAVKAKYPSIQVTD